MERRKFLIGLGSVAAGSATLVGSGAFTTVEAERVASVKTTEDSKAYLRLAPANGPNGAYAYQADDGTLEIDLSESNDDVPGDGVNPDAVTEVDDVFVVQNQGTQEVDVWFEGTGSYVDFEADVSGDIEDESDPVTLDVGDQATVSLVVDATGVEKGEELIDGDITVRAEA